MKTTLQVAHIMGCHEIEICYKRPLFNKMTLIKSSEDADNVLREFVNLKRIDLKEFYWVMLLSQSNRVLGISEIGSGTITGVATNLKEVYQLVLMTNSSALIVCHNHPSGNLKPSQSDKEVTEKLQKLADLIDVTLLDHLIITSEGYFSFSDNHLM
ncbi:JAB domain-containing protein [Psychroserpens algicola]|uniref:JAB domain-containing protein n=1 Tax=Psychroserpens algicola TaxID=1719034 RepID=A0ABT0H5F9_9FLAO|nr:JAB domain-containing protein [Psychroserpens algicola]MCK8479035.1 JAB domain-containing protein [Psychroserpens algicola]